MEIICGECKNYKGHGDCAIKPTKVKHVVYGYITSYQSVFTKNKNFDCEDFKKRSWFK